MPHVLAALAGAFLLSLSDLCTSYALEHGISDLTHTFWGHGVVYLVAVLLAVLLLSERGRAGHTIRFPEDTTAGCACLLAGLFSFLAIFAINASFRESKNIGYTVAIVSTTSLITLFLSALLFGKPLNSRATVGALCVFLGVLLISSGAKS